MVRELKRSRFLVAIAGGAALMGALVTAGHAQVEDSLKCYRLREGGRDTWAANSHASDALALASSFTPPFPLDAGCRLLPRNGAIPREICVAADKQPSLPPVGADLTGYYACYAMTCPAAPSNQDIQLTNEFGSGNPTVRQKTVRRTLCVPATNP